MMRVLVVILLFVTGLFGCQNGSQDLNQNLGPDLSPTDITNNNRGVGLTGRFEYHTARQLFAELAEQRSDQPVVNLDVLLDIQANLAIVYAESLSEAKNSLAVGHHLPLPRWFSAQNNGCAACTSIRLWLATAL